MLEPFLVSERIWLRRLGYAVRASKQRLVVSIMQCRLLSIHSELLLVPLLCLLPELLLLLLHKPLGLWCQRHSSAHAARGCLMHDAGTRRCPRHRSTLSTPTRLQRQLFLLGGRRRL